VRASTRGGSWPFVLPGAGGSAEDIRIREAAWIARCVGRGATAPLTGQDVAALADSLASVELAPGGVLFRADDTASAGVWILRQGRVELSVGSGRRRVVVAVLGPGDVEGDIPLLLGRPLPYTARALDDVTCLHLTGAAFEALLAARPAIGRRWLSSIAERVAASHGRLIGLLGRSLPAQVAGLLLDEADDGAVHLPQRTIAAMLGVARPSLNKILKDFERRGHVTVGYRSVPDDPTSIAMVPIMAISAPNTIPPASPATTPCPTRVPMPVRVPMLVAMVTSRSGGPPDAGLDRQHGLDRPRTSVTTITERVIRHRSGWTGRLASGRVTADAAPGSRTGNRRSPRSTGPGS
jgi:CRP-like cAMP-binding protein